MGATSYLHAYHTCCERQLIKMVLLMELQILSPHVHDVIAYGMIMTPACFKIKTIIKQS